MARCNGEDLVIEWYQTYGDGRRQGSNMNYAPVTSTSDGGYILGVRSESDRGDIDRWLIKTDSEGIVQWDRTYGGENDDGGGIILETEDGGYLIFGPTKSFGDGTPEAQDGWLLKVDSEGDSLWSKTYSGEGDRRVEETKLLPVLGRFSLSL